MKIQHIAAILTGQTNSIIKSNKADELPLFGQGKDRSELHWTGVIRQAVLQGYLKKDIESYGVLKLCPSALDFLEHPRPFMIREDRDYGREDESSNKNAESAGALDEVLFKLLEETRKKMAHKLGLPPLPFSRENSLLEMALHYPVNEGELKQISGVGEGKVKIWKGVYPGHQRPCSGSGNRQRRQLLRSIRQPTDRRAKWPSYRRWTEKFP